MIKCPICKGSGKIPVFKSLSIEKRRSIANKLKEQNLSIREIMKVLGYKSPRSVQQLLTKKL
jgi:predicted DNA-binding ArsR family transcriptional regulator